MRKLIVLFKDEREKDLVLWFCQINGHVGGEVSTFDNKNLLDIYIKCAVVETETSSISFIQVVWTVQSHEYDHII